MGAGVYQTSTGLMIWVVALGKEELLGPGGGGHRWETSWAWESEHGWSRGPELSPV